MATQMFSATVTTPGTKQQLTSAVAPALPVLSGVLAGPAELRGSAIIFQADPNNTAAKNVYIGGPAMNVGARTGIGMVLAPGAFSPLIEINGTTSLSDFWIDIDAAAAVKNLFVTVVG